MCSVSFTTDFNTFLLGPIQKLAQYLQIVLRDPISVYDEYLISKSDPNKGIKENIQEYKYIENYLMKISRYLGAAHGSKSVEMISRPLI